MNILRVIGSMNPADGGPGQGIRHSIAELTRQGIHNEVVCLNDPADEFLTHDTFPIHALGAGKGPWQYDKRLMGWLRSNVARFDVLIVHGLWIYPGFAVWRVIRELRKEKGSASVPAVFVMPHGMLDPYFQRSHQRRLKAFRNVIYWQLIERKLVNGADGLLFTSTTEQQLARESFHPYRPKKEINVGYGIPAPPAFTSSMRAAFQTKCPDVSGDAYLLFLGRIHYKKGIDLLLHAYAAVAEQPTDPAHPLPKLVVAGPGLDTPYGQQLHQLVREHPGLSGRVLFAGMLEGEAKWGALYGCDAFVLPSHQENFGIAVVEALACDKPVLISNQINIWREIQQQQSGLVADDTLAGTQQVLTQWLALSPTAKQTMGARARSTYEHHFAIGPAVSRLLKALRQ